MKISIWLSMGINPTTKLSYHVIIDPMKGELEKLQYSTESKFGLYWFVIKNFTKSYITLMKGNDEFIARSKAVATYHPKEGDVELVKVKKKYYRKKYKK